MRISLRRRSNFFSGMRAHDVVHLPVRSFVHSPIQLRIVIIIIIIRDTRRLLTQDLNGCLQGKAHPSNHCFAWRSLYSHAFSSLPLLSKLRKRLDFARSVPLFHSFMRIAPRSSLPPSCGGDFSAHFTTKRLHSCPRPTRVSKNMHDACAVCSRVEGPFLSLRVRRRGTQIDEIAARQEGRP